MSGIIGTHLLAQVGFIVQDIEATKREFAKFFGVPVPDHFDGGKFEITKTAYLGQSAPKANCLMAFFDVGENLQIELIQPNGEKSTWQDYLNEHGEGIHHLAFTINGMETQIQNCEKFGMKLVQRGEYADGDGRYAYLDAGQSLKCLIELLEND